MTTARSVNSPVGHAGPADHISGRIDVRLGHDGRWPPSSRSRQTRALAVTSTMRAPSLPDVPTMATAGLPDFVVTGWFAFAAPAATPEAIMQRMSSALQEILQREDTNEALAPDSVEVAHLPPTQLKEHIRREAKRFGDLVQQLNIQPG